MAELNLQAIKDRVARGRLQGGNPTGGEDGPFHLYHLALDDLDALIAVADPEEIAKRDARIEELENEHAFFASGGPMPRDDNGPKFGALDGNASVETFQSPRVAEISDEKRAELLAVAEEHKE